MDLFQEILINALAKEKINITFPNLTFTPAEIVEMESYKALQKIKAIIETDNLDDFMCIEEIVCVLEKIGTNGGGRHDFR